MLIALSRFSLRSMSFMDFLSDVARALFSAAVTTMYRFFTDEINKSSPKLASCTKYTLRPDELT